MNEHELRQRAREISKTQGIAYQKALGVLALAHGHSHWGSLLKSLSNSLTTSAMAPVRLVVGCHGDDRLPQPADFTRFRDAIAEGTATVRINREWQQVWIEHSGDIVQLHHDIAQARDIDDAVLRDEARAAMTVLAEQCDWTSKASNPPIDEQEREQYALMAAMCRAHGIEDMPILAMITASPFEGYRLNNGYGDLQVIFTPRAVAALDTLCPRSCEVRWVSNRLHVQWRRGYPFPNADPKNPTAVLERYDLVGVDCITGIVQYQRGTHPEAPGTIEREVGPAAPRGPVIHYDNIPGNASRIQDRQWEIGAYDDDGRKITDIKQIYNTVAIVSRQAFAREIDQAEDLIDLLDQTAVRLLSEVRIDSTDGAQWEFTFDLHVPNGAVDQILTAFHTLGLTPHGIIVREGRKVLKRFKCAEPKTRAA